MVCAHRFVEIAGVKEHQLLVHWKGQFLKDATWVNTLYFKTFFLDYNLEDKVNFENPNYG